jgi:FixJ family two-component response regulator
VIALPAQCVAGGLPDKTSIAPYESLIVFGSSLLYGDRMAGDPSTRFIVIVDDDESVQSALQDLMESDGLSARCFGSAKEFLKSGLQNSAACLILDIRMPGMSGLELQARLKADGLNAPIIFITAHGDARVRMQAMREGAAEFLVKPFDRQVLLNRVRAALDM